MSDSNTSRKNAARQVNASHYELARAYARNGLHDSAVKIGNLTYNSPESKGAAAFFAARVAFAGAKSYGKSAYHAGMGMMEGFMRQNPNDGRQLNNIRISQALAQGRRQSVTNKGIEAARQKSALTRGPQSGQSSNQGIKIYQSKVGGQSIGTVQGSASRVIKGTSTSNVKSGGGATGGKSSGGQSR